MLVRLYFHLLKTLSLAAGCFLLVAASAQTSQSTVAGISDPDAISDHAHSILEHGLRVTGLTAKDWKPWHLKANYQIANQGTANGTGTVEEWWMGPDQWRRTYVTKDGTWSEWSVSRSQKLQTKARFPYVPVDLRVAAPLIDPLRQAENFKPEYQMDAKPQNAGIALDCVSVVSPQRYTDGIDPDYLFPKLCFDASPLLRFIVTSDTTVTYNKYQVFQARGVAFQVEVTVLGKKTSTMDITLLEPLSAGDEAQVKPDANAIPQPLAIVAGMRKPVPVYQEGAVYPSAAMHDHILGGVAVPVIIQRDGKVKVNGPASGNYLLGQSAADAISHWKFEPYLVDGQPVEIATTLVYVFDGKPFASQVGKSNAPSTSGYDPKRDPDKDLAQAIAEAKQSHKRILMEVGGDWCIWCTYMDEFYANHKDVDSLRSANYVVLKVNMSSENGNRAFLMQYPKIPGFPHLFVLDTDGHLLQSQSTGDLESGNGYSVDRVRAFLTHWKAS